jgi:hypothetical protein
MESDLAALTSLKAQVLVRVYEMIGSTAKGAGTRVERVKVLDFFVDALDSQESVDEAVGRLREHLQKLVAEGAKIIVE